MIYTAIDTFYLTDQQLKTSPSRKDGIDEATETTLRIYGCDLIQESGILLKLYPLRSSVHLISLILVFGRLENNLSMFFKLQKILSEVIIELFLVYVDHILFYIAFFISLSMLRPQAVMATGQVLFHRFYCKKSFARFNVKVSFFAHYFSYYL